MYDTTTLTITGHGGEPVPHAFWRQAGDASHLAIILPGVAYTCNHPLLYYPSRLLLDRGADVLRLEYARQDQQGIRALSDPARMQQFYTDVTAACRAGLALRAYRRLTLVGKSLGTLAMGHLCAAGELPAETRAVWLTPLLLVERLREQIAGCARRSLFVIGTADPQYDAAHLLDLRQATKGDAVVIESADHSMEIPGDVMGSLDALRQVMSALGQFV